MAGIDPSAFWDFGRELVSTVRGGGSRMTARVSRIDGSGTIWLRVPGADGEVPATTTADVQAGDVVSAVWGGNGVQVIGNATSPSVGTRAAAVMSKATAAARAVADGAHAIAEATNQHFFTDDSGVHVSSEPDNAIGERNILINSLGILLRHADKYRAAFTDSAVAFYDGLGNAASNVVATFGTGGATIGKTSSGGYVTIDSRSMSVVSSGYRTGTFGASGVVVGLDGRARAVVTSGEMALYNSALQLCMRVSAGSSSVQQVVRTYVVEDGATEDTFSFYNDRLSSGASSGVSITSVEVDGTSVSFQTLHTATDAYLPDGSLYLSVSYSCKLSSAVTGPATVVVTGTAPTPSVTAVFGPTTGSHVTVSSDGVSIAGSDGADVLSLSSGAITLGETTGRHVTIDGDSVDFRSWTGSGTQTEATITSYGIGLASSSGENTTLRTDEEAYDSSFYPITGDFPSYVTALDLRSPEGASSSVTPVRIYDGHIAATSLMAEDVYVGDVYSSSDNSKLGWTYLGASSTTSTSYTLASSHTHLLLTGHNSTPALNGLWIVRPGGNTAFNLSGGGNVTVTVSGTTLTLKTSAGTINAWAYELPSV